MPNLIVNADDFGRSAGVNRGILEAHEKGIVTSTTVMINYEDAPAGLEVALETAPDLGLGLHLTLSSGGPVSPPGEVPSLVGEGGRFHPVARLAERIKGWEAEDLEREMRAQVARFIALAGRPPDHLDSHHHAAYLHPDALRTMLGLAAEYNLPIRRPEVAPTPAETAAAMRHLRKEFTPALALELAEGIHTVLEGAAMPPSPDRLETGFFGPGTILGELLVILTNLPAQGVTELMCHPGYVDGLDGGYTVERQRELEALTHPSVHEVVAAERIRLMTFAELPR